MLSYFSLLCAVSALLAPLGPSGDQKSVDYDLAFKELWSEGRKLRVGPSSGTPMSMGELHAWMKSRGATPEDRTRENAIRAEMKKLGLVAPQTASIRVTCRGGVCETLAVDRRPPKKELTEPENAEVRSALRAASTICQPHGYPATMMGGTRHGYRSLYSHFCIFDR